MSGGPLPGLDGLEVLDLSDDVAGAYCAKLLTDAGATVTKLERPDGHSLRRWSDSHAVSTDGDEDGALFRFLASSQHSLILDPAAPEADAVISGLSAASDVVIVSAIGGRGARALTGVDPVALSNAHADVVVVSLTAFGLNGPRGGERSSEFLLQARCGALHTHGSPDGLPLAVGGGLADWTIGTYGAVGAMSALAVRRQRGTGALVDVSALECLAMTFTCYPSVGASMPGGQRKRSTYVMIPGIEPCLDGYVGIATITTAQWQTFLDMIGRPDLADDTTLYNQHDRDRPDVLAAIVDWTGRHTVDEVVQMGSLYRIPTVPIGNGKLFPGFPHVMARQVYDTNPRGGFPHPRPPFRSTLTDRVPPKPAPTLAERTPAGGATAGRRPSSRPFVADGAPADDTTGALPLAGVRILDFTAFLAGPMATQYLGSLGADVVKIESVQRPDPMRFSVRVEPTVDQWYEQGAIFQSANLNKRSATLNLSDPRGRDIALRLAAEADVVIENFTPRVMEQFGLAYDDLRAVNPPIIMVRMPGFGLDGPWRDRPGFAASMEQVSGLAWITGYTDRLPTIPGICDPLAGMHSAFAVLAALEHRERTGEGQMIELAMIDMAANLVIEQVLEHAVYGHLMARQGNRRPGSAHQGVYACDAPDQWVAVTIGTDEELQALGAALGSPTWLLGPGLKAIQGDHASADEIDAGLAPWFARRSQKDALAVLRSAGVPAEPVVHAYDMDLDEQMNARAYWEEVVHPIVGATRFPGWPIRDSSRTSPWFRRPAPLLGQHSEEVFTAVGITGEELTALRVDGVTGTRPAAL